MGIKTVRRNTYERASELDAGGMRWEGIVKGGECFALLGLQE
jgi:hypothetical protein